MDAGSSRCMRADYIDQIRLYFYKKSQTIYLNEEMYIEKFLHLVLPSRLVYDA